MRLFHKNAPFNPVIAEKGNSIILYETKQPVSIPNTANARFYEVKVKGQTLLVETRSLASGVEIATLNTNCGPFEFILREARKLQPVVILNPQMPKANVDASDKAAFYLDSPATVVKESKIEPPSNFWNYETARLVHNSIAPLSAHLAEQVEQSANSIKAISEKLSASVEGVRAQLEKNLTKNVDLIREAQDQAQAQNWSKVQQNSDAMKAATAQLTASIEVSRQLLERKVNDDLRILKEQQEEAISQSWNLIQKQSQDTIKLLTEKAESELTARVARDLAAQVRGIIEEKVAANKQLLLQETQSLFANLSGEAHSWLTEQSKLLTESIDSQLQSKEETTGQLLQEKVDATAKYVSTELSTLEEKIVKQVIKLKEKIDNRIADGLAELNETTAKSQEFLSTFPQDILAEKFELQKKELKKEFQSSIDKQIASVRKMALHAAESGGGSVAVNYAQGGTINGNLTINGVISASQYLGISSSGSGGAYVPLSGGAVTGTLTVNILSAAQYQGIPSSAGLYLPLSGGTVSGQISATTFTATSTAFGTRASLTPNQFSWSIVGVGIPSVTNDSNFFSVGTNRYSFGTQYICDGAQFSPYNGIVVTPTYSSWGETPGAISMTMKRTSSSDYHGITTRYDPVLSAYKLETYYSAVSNMRALYIGVSGSSSAVVITTGGNIGIGTTTPSTLLQVQYNGSSGISIVRSGVPTQTFGLHGNGNNHNLDGQGGKTVVFNAGGSFPTGATTVFNWTDNGTSLMYLNHSGALGIGTPPTSMLHVSSSALSAVFTVGASPASTFLTVLSGGNVGIGTGAPSQRLTTVGNISATGYVSPSNTFGAVSAAVFQATTTLDFNGNAFVVIPTTGDITIATVNRSVGIGKTVSCILSGDGTGHNLTFESSWNWFVTVPTALAAGKRGWLTLTSLGTATSDVYAAYKESV